MRGTCLSASPSQNETLRTRFTACDRGSRAMSRATPAEQAMVLPGDHLVAEPATQVTRARTIDASPEAVWRWVAQIGADRGGFYSYDWLENLFRLGIHSADRVAPEWQTRDVGELVFANRAGTGGWYVQYFGPNDA